MNEYTCANKTFADVFENAVGATARSLDTRTEGMAAVVYNPLSTTGYGADPVSYPPTVAAHPCQHAPPVRPVRAIASEQPVVPSPV